MCRSLFFSSGTLLQSAFSLPMPPLKHLSLQLPEWVSRTLQIKIPFLFFRTGSQRAMGHSLPLIPFQCMQHNTHLYIFRGEKLLLVMCRPHNLFHTTPGSPNTAACLVMLTNSLLLTSVALCSSEILILSSDRCFFIICKEWMKPTQLSYIKQHTVNTFTEHLFLNGYYTYFTIWKKKQQMQLLNHLHRNNKQVHFHLILMTHNLIISQIYSLACFRGRGLISWSHCEFWLSHISRKWVFFL